MKDLIDLLKITFDAGRNFGFAEAAHQLNMLMSKNPKGFSEFLDIPEVKFIIEQINNKLA